MNLADSLMVSLIGLTVVFMVLILLSSLIKLQSLVLGYIMAPKRKLDESTINRTGIINVSVKAETAFTTELTETVDEGWSAGELKLLGVDEKTAAMIMAIVSHESQIPLSELQFKMIKALN